MGAVGGLTLWSALWWALRLAPLGLTVAAALAVWRTSPLAEPFVAQGVEEVRATLDAAMARALPPERLREEVAAAVAAEDLDRVEMLVRLGLDRGLAPGPDLQAEIAALEETQRGWMAQAGHCGRCMADLAACPSVRMLAMCGVPFELTPAGDLNALRRAGLAGWAGAEVDEIEVSLALVGLGATAAVAVSGGSSASVKAGATAIRAARRMGRLRPDLAADLARNSRLAVDPAALRPWVRGEVSLEAVVDAARLGVLTAAAADFGRLAANSSATDAVLMLRHAGSVEDVARLARVSDAAGPATRATLDTLGAPRAFRALVRLADKAIGAMALLYAAVLQVALLVASLLGGLLWRRALARVRPGRAG